MMIIIIKIKKNCDNFNLEIDLKHLTELKDRYTLDPK
jgi:hypothetical protein